MFGSDPLQFRPVDIAAATACEVMTMTVAMTAPSVQFTPSRNRDPRTEGHQRDARRRVDDMAEARRDGSTGEPNDQRNQQSREHVAEAGLERRARRLALRPASLTRNESDRHPVVRNDRVQDANGGDGADQQQLRTEIHHPSS